MIMIALAVNAQQLLLSAFILGIGFGSAHSSVMAMAADRLPVVERGVGMATFTSAFDLGIVAGSVALGILLNWFDFTALFILCALLMLAPVAVYFLRYKRLSAA
jgi:MFS family permease